MRCRTGLIQEAAYGRAVEVLVELEDGDPPEWAAGVTTWFLDVPGQTPFWRHYLLSVIHLRDLDGVPPAVIRIPHATHELMLWALDPRPGPVPTDHTTWSILRPFNVAEQLQLPSDESAKHIGLLAAKAVVTGYLPAEPPLAGAVEPWRTALIKSAAHERGEVHAP